MKQVNNYLNHFDPEKGQFVDILLERLTSATDGTPTT